MKSPHQESPSVRAGEATGAGEGPTPDEGANERGPVPTTASKAHAPDLGEDVGLDGDG
jgi:hypothetical protein